MSDFFQTDAEISILVEGFNSRTLAKEAWTHEAHLTIGIYFVYTFDFQEAVVRLKLEITRA